MLLMLYCEGGYLDASLGNLAHGCNGLNSTVAE